MKSNLSSVAKATSLQQEFLSAIKKYRNSSNLNQIAHHALVNLANQIELESEQHNVIDQGHAEISGLLEAVEILGADSFNKWKEENPDVEVVHINSMVYDTSFIYTVVFRKGV